MVVASELAQDNTDTMICGLGTDIIAIARVEGIYTRHPERFLEQYFTDSERSYCLSHRHPAQYLAARWAAKEACLKALGTGAADGIYFNDICITRAENGKPGIELSNGALERANTLGVRTVWCTLSHADGMATATVILEN